MSFPSKIQGIKVVEVDLGFSNAEQIKTVNIPDTVTKIYTRYYSDNKTALSSVTVDSNNKTYSSENGVLFDKSKKKLIYYPQRKTDKQYTVPASVESLDYRAFTSVYLEGITLGKNISVVEYDSFCKCSSLKSISVNSSNANFRSQDGVLYSKDMKSAYAYPPAKSGSEYKSPSTVEYYKLGLFANCNNLKSIQFSKNSYYISSDFTQTPNLEKFTIPSGNKYYKTVNDVLYVTNYNEGTYRLLSYPCAKKGDYYKMPDDTVEVYYEAFGGNKNLNYISYSKNLIKFHPSHLSKMKQLKEIALFGKKTEIDYNTPKNIENGNVIIHGYSGSTAYTYAKEKKLKFEEIKGMTPTSISINKTGLSLGVNEAYQLAAVVKPFYATNKTVTWTTGNSKIATVSGGKVTAKNVGQTKITVKTSNGKTASCNITAKKAPEKVTLTKGILSLGVGETFTIGSGVNDGAASAQRTYRTSNSTIVKMLKTDWTGVFQGVKPGVAYVTVRTYNGKESTCKVTVKNAPAWIKMNKTDVTIKVGQKLSVGSYIPSDAALATRKYFISDYTNNGVIKLTKNSWVAEFVGMKPGYAIVRIETYNGKTASCYITVKK